MSANVLHEERFADVEQRTVCVIFCNRGAGGDGGVV